MQFISSPGRWLDRFLLRKHLLAGSALIGSVAFLMPAASPGLAATLDLEGLDATLPAIGYFGDKAYLNGSDDVTNSGCRPVGETMQCAIVSQPTVARLTEGGGPAGTLYSGRVSDGSSTETTGIVHTGGYVLITNGANTYSGGTAIDGGTIAVGNNSALGTGGLTFNSGTLQAAAAGLTLTNTATLASNGTIDTNGNSLTYAGMIAGSSTLTKVGSGTLTLTAANDSMGSITVRAGTLQVASGAAVTSPLSNGAAVGNSGSWTGAVNGNTGSIQNGANASWTGGTVMSNAGTIGNSGAWSGDVQANTGTIGNNGRWTGSVVSNAGTIGNVGLWTGNMRANTGTVGNGGTWAGSIVNSAGGTVTNVGIVTAGVTNAGIFNAIGGVPALTGSATAAAVINGPISNSGTFNVTGPTTANTSQFYPVLPASLSPSYPTNGITQSGGSFDNTGVLNVAAGGSYTIAGRLINETGGQVNNAGKLALPSQALQNLGTFATSTGSTFSGGLNNTGTVNAAGGAINGPITNAGLFNIAGTVTTDSAFENTGTLSVAGPGNYTITGNLRNDKGGQVIVAAGGSLTDDLINAGIVINGGTYTANVTNNSGGQITNSGTWNGSLTNNAGAAVNNSGTWNGDVTNGGTVSNSGVFTGNFTNAGAGTLLSSGGSINALTNSGTIDLSAAAPGTVALSGNSYVGNPGSTVIAGVDLRSQAVSPTGGQATLIKFNAASGTTSLVFKNIGSQALISYYPTIPVVNVGAGNGVFVVDQASLAALSNGLISYGFGNGALNGSLNTSAVLAAGVQTTTVLTTLNTNFFQDWQPFERQAFITGQQDAPVNSLAGGPWIRGKYGNETDDAVVTAAGIASKTRVGTEFSGFQVGGDIGVFNIDKTGWNFIAGVTGGEFFATSHEKLGGTTRGVFEIPFVGAYAALTRGPFFVDVMYHHDFYGMKLNDAPSGLNNQKLSGSGDSVHIESAYNVGLGDYGQLGHLFIAPTGSLIFSKVSLDALPFTTLNIGKVKFGDIDSVMGRIGFRFGSNFQTDTLALQPFIQASVWHEFEGNALSEFDATSGVVVPMSVSRVSTFGQFGLGLNGELLGKNLLGTIRGDFRVGGNTSGESVTAQLRYQF
jgi:hypothetical protein